MKKYCFLFLILMTIVVSCVKDDDYAVPKIPEIVQRTIPFKEDTFNVSFRQGLWRSVTTVGTRGWYTTNRDNIQFATFSAFNFDIKKGDNVVSWLISPRFDFDKQNNESLEFKLADAYSKGNPLKVMYSNDFDGNQSPDKATWKELIVPNTKLFNNTKKSDDKYESSGVIDLSTIKGKAVIAFVYNSNGGKISSTAQISEVEIATNKKPEKIKPETKKIIPGTLPFTEDFDKGIDKKVWTLSNTQGTRNWQAKDFKSVHYAQMSAFNGKGKSILSVKAFLISPQFDFDKQENETLEFKLADAFSSTGNPLKLMYSNDYNGTNLDKSTWKELTIPNLFNNTGKYDNKYESSGAIDLSTIKGKAVIAFVYDSNGGKISSTAQLSEVNFATGGGTTGPNQSPKAAVSITGKPQVGQSLTANTSASTDPDGDTLTFTYQWYRADNNAATGETAISGETGATYTLTAGDKDKYITVKVTANDGKVDSNEVSADYTAKIRDAITPPSGSTLSDLIISEYVEGSSNNKYLEIYNNTGAAVDLSDYTIQVYINGSNNPGKEQKLGDLLRSLDNGKTLVIKNSNAALTLPTGITAISSTALTFNGDDVVALTKSGTIIDLFGTIGNKKGNYFAKDKTFRRKNTVTGPSATYDTSQWDEFSKDTVDGLGSF